MFFKFKKIIFVVQVQRRGGARLSLCVPRVRHQPGDGGAAAPGAHAGGRAGHVPHTGRGTNPHPFHQLPVTTAYWVSAGKKMSHNSWI